MISLDYPICPVPRWGHGKPPHPRMTEILSRSRGRYREHLQTIANVRTDLEKIPISSARQSEPQWKNGWFEGLDAAFLYAIVKRGTRRYIEVGSGMSTKFVRKASRTVHVTSIDPSPRSEIDVLCNRVLRVPVENIDLAVFDELERDDILFVDNSHCVFQNSDVVAIMLDVLPRLKDGVLVHFHDIFLPFDYPPEWATRFYSEQYLLAAWLLADGPHLSIEFPSFFICHDPELRPILSSLWGGPLARVAKHGGSFWVRVHR